MLIIFIRAIILYVLLIASVRLMGKHQLGQLQPSELAVTILISNIATLPVEDPDLPLITGIIPILTLASLDVLMSWIGLKSKIIRRLSCGKPVIIIKDGKIDQQKMKELRFTADDLIEAMRSSNIFDLNEIQFAVVETTGVVSFYQKYQYRNVTNEDLQLNQNTQNPPEMVIDDGNINIDALKRTGYGISWLTKKLSEKNLSLKNVFIMTLDSKGKSIIIERENKK